MENDKKKKKKNLRVGCYPFGVSGVSTCGRIFGGKVQQTWPSTININLHLCIIESTISQYYLSVDATSCSRHAHNWPRGRAFTHLKKAR